MRSCRGLVRRFASKQTKYDAVIIGGGHNGLTAAAYLQKSGSQVCVLERRNIIGGAAVTEEIVPGFKFSRASYVLSLLRPQIYSDLKLKDFGLNVIPRTTSSYTPLREQFWKGDVRSLTMGACAIANEREISKFSKKDAAAFHRYEDLLGRVAIALDPLLDIAPYQALNVLRGSAMNRIAALARDKNLRQVVAGIIGLGADAISLFELLTASPLKILRRWFENEVLITTLAMDAAIGTMEALTAAGTGYVLLLHSMVGHCEGVRGRWGYPVGGMGSVSQALAASATALGAHVRTDQCVTEILLDSNGSARGVRTSSGEEVVGDVILSCATPQVTFFDLLPRGVLPKEFENSLRQIDYSSGVTKINVAVDKLPNFAANPIVKENTASPLHQATIHINSERITCLTDAHNDAYSGRFSDRPLIEMVIPSVVDNTIAPEDCHVCLLFTQYTPYHLKDGVWDDSTKELYATKVFNLIDEYAPGFSASVVGKEVLTPPDLETEFGLTGGNIFHGSMSPDNLFFLRPTNHEVASPYTPMRQLLLCGSGAHPGGGVSGAPGRIAAIEAQRILSKM